MSDVRLESSWKEVLASEFTQPYWGELTAFVRQEYTQKTVFPEPQNIFRAFDLCPFESTHVVILGQDPYHGKGQANGLSFAVNSGTTLPPSLKNIFKEIEQDMGYRPEYNGDLTRWARQGVLLLNSVLTVQMASPASHKGKGWEKFTDAVIRALSNKKKHVVYMLWGKYAQEKGQVVDSDQNLILTSGHPSPYSAQLFHGHHHFSRCNEYLENNDLTPIDWH